MSHEDESEKKEKRRFTFIIFGGRRVTLSKLFPLLRRFLMQVTGEKIFYYLNKAYHE